MKYLVASAILAMTGTVGTAYAHGPDPAPASGHHDGIVYSGTLEVWGAALFARGNPSSVIDDEASPEFGGSGRVTIPMPGRVGGYAVSIQADIDGSANFPGGDDDGIGADDTMGQSFLGTAHLSMRKPGSHLFGLFAGFGTASASEDEVVQVFIGGVEAQYHVNRNLTLYAQGGFFTAEHPEDNSGDGIENAWFTRLVGRYFFNDESFIEAEGTYAQGDIDPGETLAGQPDKDNMVAWGVKYQRRMSTEAPIYYFAGYQGSTAEERNDSRRYIEHRAMFGFQFAFNGGVTARQNNHHGTTLSAPTAIARWAGYSMEALD